jgi:hypothetical protein
MSIKKRLISEYGFDCNSTTITSVADPVNAQDAETKAHVAANYQPLDADLTALAAINTDGLIAHTAAGTVATRTLTGTTNTITVTNGNGVSGDPTVTIADNPAVPGTKKFTWPSGTTAQRPAAPVNGDSRYNTDLGVYEQYSNGVWNPIPISDTLGAVQARRTTTYTTTTTATDLTFDAVDITTNTAICNRDATNTARFVAYQEGTYEILFNASLIASNSSSVITFNIVVNGTTVLNQGNLVIRPASTTAQESATTSCFVTLAANDYVTLRLSHASSSSTIQVGAELMFKKLEGVRGNTGASGGSTSLYHSANMLDSPTTGWALTAASVVQADPTTTSLTVRAFDDTLVEGAGTLIYIPPTATSLTLTITHRAATAPATAKAVILQLYNRDVLLNAAVEAWSAATTLATVSIPTNAFFQTYSTTITLTTLGMTAGVTNQIQVVRQGSSASDTLVGDWYLLDFLVSFS